jgi:starch phosphorylase
MVFRVVPRLPERLESLRRIAGNAWWTWNRSAVSLFRSVDQELWESCGHNPILLLGRASQARMNELAEDPVFLSRLEEVENDLENYMSKDGWFAREHPGLLEGSDVVAYFSAEFGIHESLPIYSGGLGVLAGDTIKSAGDLGSPSWNHPALPAGLLQPVSEQRRLAAGAVSGQRLLQHARGAGEGGERRACGDLGAHGGQNRESRGLEAARGRASLLLLDANLPDNPPRIG